MPPRKAATAASAHAEGDRRRVDRLGRSIGTEAKANRRKTQCRDRAPRAIPSPTAPGYLAIYDSQDLVATLVQRDQSHHLFSPSGKWLGAYASRAEAMRAAPRCRSRGA